MKEWPKNGKVASFSEITEPIEKAMKFCYTLKRKKALQSIIDSEKNK